MSIALELSLDTRDNARDAHHHGLGASVLEVDTWAPDRAATAHVPRSRSPRRPLAVVLLRQPTRTRDTGEQPRRPI